MVLIKTYSLFGGHSNLVLNHHTREADERKTERKDRRIVEEKYQMAIADLYINTAQLWAQQIIPIWWVKMV